MDILVPIFLVVVSIFLYFKWIHSYWRRKNIPYLHPRIPFGTPGNPFNKKVHLGLDLQTPYRELKNQNYKHGGLYWFVKPIYMLIEPEYIKRILVQDFQYFTDRAVFCNEKNDPLSNHLFNIEGAAWNKIRTKLTPTFTSGKIKMMFKLIEKCGNELKDAVNEHCNTGEPVDIKNLLECFTTDVIGSCAFGIECNSFKNPSNDFRTNCLKVLQAAGFRSVKSIFCICYPQLAKLLKFRMFSREIGQFFLSIVQNTINYREENHVIRNDYLNLLMNLRKCDDNEDGLTMTEIAAQSFVIFVAGFETSSTTMSFCLYELACNEDIQDKVRKELFKTIVGDNQGISYETVTKLKYLGQVISETLRKYPPLPYLTRRCVKDYQIPNSNTTIDKGTMVIIPCYALHHDSEFYPDPDDFNPERFSLENKETIPPSAYLPFGEGPRNCVGFRFGMLQVKLGLLLLLKHFKFTLNDKTKTPLEFKCQGHFLNNREKIWLDVEAIDANGT